MKHLALVLLLALQYTFSVDVDLVVFNVSVVDDEGRAITGLTADSFRVLEGDSEQTIKTFHAEESPATVGLIIDNSGSMTAKRREVINAGLAFVRGMDSKDEVFIVNFNRRAWMGLPAGMAFTNNIEQLRAALQAIRADGTTALYDALEMSLTHLEKGSNDRKALVLLSDGADNASFTTLEEIERLATRSSATIYTIGIYDSMQRDKNPGVLKDLAKLTGGQAFFPRRVQDLHQVWLRIAGAIRGQYTLGFSPKDLNHDGAFHKVEIRAANGRGQRLRVRTRPGYYAPISDKR